VEGGGEYFNCDSFGKRFDISAAGGSQMESKEEAGRGQGEGTTREHKIVGAEVESEEGGVSSPIAQSLQQRHESLVSQADPLQAERGKLSEKEGGGGVTDQMSVMEEQSPARVSARILTPLLPSLLRMRVEGEGGGERTCSRRGPAS
jgi:hypothetical protein